MEPAEPASQLLADLGIERAERLIEQQDRGLHGQRPRQRDALPLTARELRRLAVSETVELHERQQLVDAGAICAPRAARSRGRTRKPKATFSNTVMWRKSA